MDIEELSKYLTTPDVHRKVLSGYQGAYSLGIGQSAQGAGNHVLILQVEGSPSVAFPPAVRLGNESVPLIVRTNYGVPQPL